MANSTSGSISGSMPDTICIEGLEIYARHGVFPEENAKGQTFIVSAELYADFEEAAAGDNLDKSTDYGAVCRFMTQFLQEHAYKLIETCAVNTAEAVLDEFPLLTGIKIRIDKPHAPIGLPFRSVAVETTRAWHEACIALGSNMGDSRAYLDGAIKALSETKGIRMDKVSDYIVTEPYGGVEQDDFLNGCAVVQTYHSPGKLLDILHKIEADADRKRTLHWGPRTLDLDIIFYDELVVDEEDLHIPHIDMQNRDFVLRPLCQIAPHLRHPLIGKTVQELLSDLNDSC